MQEKNAFGQALGFAITDWHPRPIPCIAAIHGKFCIVESLTIAKHAQDLFDCLCVGNDAASWTYMPSGPYESYSDFELWLSLETSKQDQRFYAIVHPQTQKAMGICAYLRINGQHGVIEVGAIHYAPSLKRRPAATEAMYLMMRHVFDDLGYRRYEWKCNALNEASMRSALRLGFRFEGTFRQSNVFKDRNRDTAWFSILDQEWPALKKRFERWLSPKNFSDDGSQIVRLEEV